MDIVNTNSLLFNLNRFGHNVFYRMRIPIYESKLIKTTRFEPEELDKIEHVTKTLEREALEDREDMPSESQVIRMLVRLGLEVFYNRRRSEEKKP